MRLTKQLAAEATKELVERLRVEPQGLSTKQLVGSPRFHGARTLSHYQIIKLLRASGEAKEKLVGHGKRTALLWKAERREP